MPSISRPVAPRVLTLQTACGRPVGTRVAIAGTRWQRLRGLMGRVDMPGGGLLLDRCASVHTCFMRMPIDVVFLDRASRVLRVVPDLRPWRLAGYRGARATLELPAGTCARHGLAVGDVVVAEVRK